MHTNFRSILSDQKDEVTRTGLSTLAHVILRHGNAALCIADLPGRPVEHLSTNTWSIGRIRQGVLRMLTRRNQYSHGPQFSAEEAAELPPIDQSPAYRTGVNGIPQARFDMTSDLKSAADAAFSECVGAVRFRYAGAAWRGRCSRRLRQGVERNSCCHSCRSPRPRRGPAKHQPDLSTRLDT